MNVYTLKITVSKLLLEMAIALSSLWAQLVKDPACYPLKGRKATSKFNSCSLIFFFFLLNVINHFRMAYVSGQKYDHFYGWLIAPIWFFLVFCFYLLLRLNFFFQSHLSDFRFFAFKFLIFFLEILSVCFIYTTLFIVWHILVSSHYYVAYSCEVF